MTNAQERSLKKIRQLVEKDLYNGKYEIKVWDVNENEYFVSLVVEYGRKNDEGTLAVFARDRAHLFIGKRGAVTYPVLKQLKNGKFKHYTKKFKGYSILQAVIDQR